MPRKFYHAFVWIVGLCALVSARPVSATCGFELESVLVTHTPCGQSAGQVNLVLSGSPLAPVTYLWSTGATTSSLTGLSAGSYRVTITDAASCSVETEALVRDFSGPQLSNLNATAANCGSATGSLAFNLAGQAPFTLNWSGAATGSLSGQTNNINIGNLLAGSYLVEAVDANNCRNFFRLNVPRTGGISMIGSVQQAPSCGATNGIVRGSATAGSLPFTFYLNGTLVGTFPSSSQDFTNLSAGTYRIRIVDNNGCETQQSITLDEQTAPALLASDFQFGNPNCPSSSNGFARELAPSATAYQVFNAETNTLIGALPQNSLPAGRYEIRLSTGGCQSSLAFELQGPEAWTFGSETENATCTPGFADVRSSLSGGTANYIYQWSNGTTTTTLSNVFPGNYSLTVTDAIGCTFSPGNIRVSNCSATEVVPVFTGTTLNYCVDTTDIAGNVASVINLCPGLIDNGTASALGANACFTYTAGSTLGYDTLCVEVCNAARDFCDTTTLVLQVLSPIDTLRELISTNNTANVCPPLGALTGPVSSVSNLNCSPIRLGILNSINSSTACVDYSAGLVMGYDTVCLAYCDANNFCDTAVVIFQIQSPVDTLTSTLTANSTTTICPPLTAFPGTVQTVTDLACSPLSVGGVSGINFSTGCLDYSAGNGVGADTVCLAICDDQGFCDTTILVFNVVPRADTTTLLLGAGTAAIDTCLFGFQFPASSISSITNLGCDADNQGSISVNPTTGCVNYTPPASQPNAGQRSDTVCVQFCNGTYCDTAVFIFNNQEPNCANRAVPATLSAQGPNCNSLNLCLPIPLDSISYYSLNVDGTPYTGPTTGCDLVTRIQYPFSLIPGCPGDYMLTWRIGNQNFGPVQVTGLSGIITQMNTWDLNTSWQLTSSNQIALGINNGNDNLVYGNLSIQCVGAASPTILGPTTQNQFARGTGINFSAAGSYTLYTTGPLGCIDTTSVQVLCAQTSVVTDTLILGDTSQSCAIDLSQVSNPQRIAIACQSAGEVQFSLDANNTSCINYTALNLGVDSTCVVVCDTIAGVCDTTYFVVTVILPQPVAVQDSFVLPYGASSFTFDLCSNDTFPRLAYSIQILDNTTFGSLSGSDCQWVYLPNNPNVCGRDSFRYEVRNASGADTAWVYLVAPCRPFSISEGISPNGDGINDYFVVNSLQDYPNHEIFIFNRWGNLVFQAKNYQNDWQGTFNGRDLPDGPYFYFIYLHNDRGEVFQGNLIIQR